MQRVAEIQDLYAYNRWANGRILAAVSKLSHAELSQDMKSSFPSVRDTVLHVLASEWIWLRRWLGTSPTGMPQEWHGYDLAQVSNEWAALETAQSAFLDKLNDGGLDRVVAYRNVKGEEYANPLWQLLRHMVNHSTYHRGQITTMLRQLGHEAISTDLVLYYRELKKSAAAATPQA